MQKAIMAKSFSGADFRYVKMQAYVRDHETLHIQAIGQQLNRDYGISADIQLFELSTDMVDWLKTVTKQFDSMAGSGKRYFPCQMRHIQSTNRLSFQIAAEPYNTPYGAVFTVPISEHLDLLDFWNRRNGPDLSDVMAQPEQGFAMVSEVED